MGLLTTNIVPLLLYYITDRAQFPGTESHRRKYLLAKIVEAAHAGVDYVQLREKDLATRELESLAQEAANVIRESLSKTRLLINSRTDIALAVQADGVHLTSNDISPSDVRKVWRSAHRQDEPIVVIGVSCHNETEVSEAESASVEFAVFGPVFDKRGTETPSAVGMDQLRKVCRHRIPVLALGGVTVEKARQCIDAGAAGIAGIRLFQGNDVASVVTELRRLK